MLERIPYIRVFIASPGDVTDERKIARDIIKQLPNKPAFRDQAAFRIIAWDELGADTPMRATMTPQQAIVEGLPKPSECDIVIVLFWSRMGTPFVHSDGIEYMSGTYWELLDALTSDRTETLIYRRTEEVLFTFDDTVGHKQYEQVKSFFNSDLFYEEGRVKRGFNSYIAPDDFRQRFETHFEAIVLHVLRRRESAPPIVEQDLPNVPQIETVISQRWEIGRSPFPGLRSLVESDSDIYFGRGRETDLLVRRIANSRFVAVVGSSGSGKSSLVNAGMIPRLKANAISSETVGSKDWRIIGFKPGHTPFETLAKSILEVFPHTTAQLPTNSQSIAGFSVILSEDTEQLRGVLERVLSNENAWAEVLIVIDQFEELFTLASVDDTERFINALKHCITSEKVRIVVTMRDDFFHRANAYQDLSELLRDGSFSLTTPRRDALRQMIERPAECAGIDFEDGLVEQILDDTGDEPGNLALMAYTLDELFKASSGHILKDTYFRLGGVRGAIGTRAELIYGGLERSAQEALPRVFHELVTVDERGIATRQQAPQFHFVDDVPSQQLINAYVDARLLITSSVDGIPTIEVAHEALFVGWDRLNSWIQATQEDLALLRQVRQAANEWNIRGRTEPYLWGDERLQPAYQMIRRLNPSLSDIELAFVTPEKIRLIPEFISESVTSTRRIVIADRWKTVGAPVDELRGLLFATNTPGELRIAIIKALGSVDQRSAALSLIDALIHDEFETEVVRAASDALENYKDTETVNDVILLLSNSDSYVRSNAADVLGEIGNAEAIEPLLRALNDEGEYVRSSAAKSLGKLHAPNAAPELVRLVQTDPSTTVRQFSMYGLKDLLDPSTFGIVATVSRTDKDESVREIALDTLARVFDEKFVPVFLDALQNDSASRVRSSAARGLGKTTTADVTLPLVEALQHWDRDLRHNAVVSLGYVGDERAIPALIALRNDPETFVSGSVDHAIDLIERRRHRRQTL